MFREFWSGGPYTDMGTIAEYENQFARHCGVKHGVSFGAGRMALYSILEALGIGEGDEVIIPAFTCVVVPNAIIYQGAKPVYVDIDPVLFNIDTTRIEAAITSNTKALYAQHTFGGVCDIENLRSIGIKYGIPVIEDGAHALGAFYKTKPVGSLTEVAFFSTDHSKIINTHLGGICVTNNDDIASRLRAIQQRSPFLERQLTRKLIRSFLMEYFFFLPGIFWFGGLLVAFLNRFRVFFYFLDELKTVKPTTYAYPCRLSSAQAKLGLSQLNGLINNIEHRKIIASWLEQRIGWNQTNQSGTTENAWLRYSFLVKDRAKFESNFNKHFELGTWFTTVVGGRTKGLNEVGYFGNCPKAEFVSRHIVNLPTHSKIPLQKIKKEVNRNWSWLKSEIIYFH